MAFPSVSAVAIPDLEIETTVSSLELQDTSLSVAFLGSTDADNCSVSPTVISTVLVLIATEVTSMMSVSFSEQQILQSANNTSKNKRKRKLRNSIPKPVKTFVKKILRK